MHLKNFSVIRRDLKVELSPAYDLLNSTIILNSQEELALPLCGKKNKLKKDDFFVYFAKERLGLTQKSIEQTVNLGSPIKGFVKRKNTPLFKKTYFF